MMSLEHRKRALELGMAERQQEIAVQMELMQVGGGLIFGEAGLGVGEGTGVRGTTRASRQTQRAGWDAV